ncbi:MAG: transglycosylase family protein, partial [Pseudonocardia sp.]|nr:transglycosylase family protein [Pseudonocardia sp.]
PLQQADQHKEFQDLDNPATWEAFGGQGDPAQASKDEQIAVAEKVQAEQGWNAWPACSEKLGL